MLNIVPHFQQNHEVFKGTALRMSIPYLPIKFLSEFNFKHPIHVTVQRLLFVIAEWFVLKRLKDHLVQSPCYGQRDLSLDQVFKSLSILTLNTSRNSVSTTSLCNMFHCVTILTVKNFFLVTKHSL